MADFGIRLVAYAPAGERLGLLPQPLKLEASFPHDDAGALSATYSRLALGGTILDRALSQGVELAVEVTDHGGAWVEPDGGRFLWIAKDDDLADQSRTVTITAPSYGWLLRKARLLDLSNVLPEDHSQAGKRPFYSASAGTIIATLMGENAARGGVPVTLGFDTNRDAAGQAWAKVVTLYLEPGIEVFQVLDSLTAQGMCDWRTRGRQLLVWNADTVLAADRSASVRLHLGRDVGEAPSNESLEEIVGRVLLRGDNGLALTLDNPSAPTPWGVWEGYISQGGVSDDGTARTLVQAELERRARTRAQYTRSLTLSGAQFWPMVDYAPGQWITAPTNVQAERVRVAQVTLTLEGGVPGGSVVLNDRVLDAELRRAKRMAGITGGATADGGSGARPAPEGPDRRQPAAPPGLVVSSDAYIDTDGAARGVLSMDWGDVTTATDGTAMEIADYQVAVRRNVVGAPWSVVMSADDSQATYQPVAVGEVLQVKVRARGRYSAVPGAWSSVVTVTVEDDVTPPAVPSAPVASVSRAVVRVTWDGKTAAGGTMPLDFDRVEVIQEGATNPVDSILDKTGGYILVTGLPYNQQVRYRARAVDRSGNASSWSAWSNYATPTPLVVDDIDKNITEAIEKNREDLDLLNPKVTKAQQDIANAQERITEAESEVATAIQQSGQAGSLATAASSTAKGTPRIFHSTAAPTSNDKAPQNSTWFRHQGSLSGVVIGQWTQTAAGDAGGTWTPSQLGNGVLAGLDVGKLTAGSAEVIEAVAQKIAASTAAFQRADVANLFASNATVDTQVAQRIWTAKLIAGKVLANEALIGAGPNMIPWSPESGTEPHVGWTGSAIRGLNDADLGWVIAARGSGGTNGTFSGFIALRFGGTSRNNRVGSFDVDPGSSYRFRVGIGIAGSFPEAPAAGRRVRAAIQFHDAAGASVRTATSDPVPADRYGADARYIDYIVEAPETAASATIYLDKNYWGETAGDTLVLNPSLTNATDASLIVDGSILGRHIKAKEIEGVHVKANTLTADNFIVGVMDGYVITGALIQSLAQANRGVKISESGLRAYDNAGNLTVQLEGSTASITGALIQSVAQANRGVKISESGLRAYDTSGNLTVQIEGDTASIVGGTIRGGSVVGASVQTADSGSRALLTSSTGGDPNLWMFDSRNVNRMTIGVNGETTALWLMDTAGRNRLSVMTNASFSGVLGYDSSGTTRLQINTNNQLSFYDEDGALALLVGAWNSVEGNQHGWIRGPAYGALRSTLALGVTTYDGVKSNYAQLRVEETSTGNSNNDNARVLVHGGGSWYIGSPNRGYISMANSSGEIAIYTRSNLLSFYNLPATTAAGQPLTMIVSPTGRASIYRGNGSLRAAKVDIADIDASVNPARVLDVPVRDWIDRGMYDRQHSALDEVRATDDLASLDPDVVARAGVHLPRIPGVVAEEVEAAGLAEFCTYDEDGTLTGVMYDRLPLLLIPVVRSLVERVAILESLLTTTETP
ncbi:hypothetical protein [Puerhibacterium puerhi]|uniref:hypothetical protein n=1 Tax=Puerhibacterium puerhi TaxID=2692623 RepID=UPI00135C143C|nr:hypothetical protein [Puerhibacterium puerhi]